MAEKDAEKVVSNKPPDTAFRQQKLPTWEPVMTPFKIIVIFVAIGIIFIPTGSTLMSNSNSIYENRIIYDEPNGFCSISNANEGKRCLLDFEFTETVKGPLYVYYELQNYYQNHRRYVSSLSSSQLLGMPNAKTDVTTCIGTDKNGSQVLNPCGLIANSFFTDKFTISPTSTTSNQNLNEKDISWKSDRDYKFKQIEGFQFKQVNSLADPCTFPSCKDYTDPNTGNLYHYYYPEDNTVQYLYETYPDHISPIEGITNEHFIVWMRTAGLPNFRKLYGKIDGTFKKGEHLIFNVTANYEVRSFDGTKALIISQNGEFGGQNPYLGVSYIVVGALSIFYAAVFAIKSSTSQRMLGDPSLLNWS